MPDRSNSVDGCRRRRPIAAVVFTMAVALFAAGCSGGDDDAPVSVTATSASPSKASTSTNTPTLVPPSTVASVDPAPPAAVEPGPPAYSPEPLYIEPQYTEPQDVQPRYTPTPYTQPQAPRQVDPVVPPAAPLDSYGFPLGTICGAVSCTSPDGMTFVNPDAPGPMFDLCDRTFCPPPGLQIIPDRLPSTGSSR
ncbi:MAG: hypothetical protein WBQ44_21075 [Rhodococcus sp. (in: high G+C Gram-positive bacteria)]